MSAPVPPPPPYKRGRGTRTVAAVIAMVLIVAVVVAGAGIAGLSVGSILRRGDESGPNATPPKPSSTVQVDPNRSELESFYDQELAWRGCGENQCTRLRVPLDYDDPGGKTITLSVLRVRATDRGHRVGQLVVNPGGPGGSGVNYAAGGVGTFGSTLARYFDIVGFDPRGVGESTPLECADTKLTDEFLSVDPDPDTPAEVDDLERVTREFGDGCLSKSGDLARHISTVEAAKDMDILRSALGERQLDYLGASYGTLLGSTYADLFPTRVRRMVLDGAVDPSLSYENLVLEQAHGFEVALHAYLRDCIDRGDCVVGDTVAAGAARIRQLLDDIDATPLRTSSGRELTEGLAYYGMVLPLYDKRLWRVLSVALKQAIGGSGNVLLFLADQYSSRGTNSYKDNSIAALNAVNCLDHSDSVPFSEVPKYFPEFDKASPTFGRTAAYTLSVCAAWPVKSGSRTTAIKAAGAPPIVVVGTTRDPATPYDWAVNLARQLESGVLVSRDGDGHTGFHQGNRCVDKAVQDYLVAGTVPEDGLSC